MKLLVLKENSLNENRVALTPEIVSKYKKLSVEIFVEKNDQNLPAGHIKVLIFCRSSR